MRGARRQLPSEQTGDSDVTDRVQGDQQHPPISTKEWGGARTLGDAAQEVVPLG